MKILYDEQIFQLQKYGGISRYFSELIRTNKIYSRNTIIFSKNEYLKKRNYIFIIPNRLLKLLQILYSRIYIKFSNFDVYHPTYYNTYNYNKKKLVLTVYDMIQERFFEEYSFEPGIIEKKKNLILNADAIIAISLHTKNEIISFYNVQPRKIEVIHLATSFTLKSKYMGLEIKFLNYILFVGNRNGYKNAKIIFEIANQLSKKEIHTVFMGSSSFNQQEKEYLNNNNLDSYVHHVDANSDQLMQAYYHHSICFIFPSKDEGFGIPILEAFASKTPVVLSDIAPFHEVASYAGLYFNPKSENELLNIIFRLYNEPNLRRRHIELGVKRLKNFSWEKTIHQTINLYSRFHKGT